MSVLAEQARSLRDQGRHAEAYALLQELPWPQASPELYLLKGVLERQLGHHRDALCSLAIALGHPPHHGLACYELGELHRSLGQFDQAAAWLVAALRNAPQHTWILHALQYTRFSPERLPWLTSELERHSQAHPGDAMALHLLAQLQLRLERRAEAIATSRRAARLNLGERSAWLAPAAAEATPPDFLIIGVPKGGTTSLLQWLSSHPQLWCHPRKELHFFNGAWEQGEAWYRAQFPMFEPRHGVLRGEATPNYFLDPRVPKRVAAAAPQAKLILLLRDPLQRAISWIEHLRRHEGVDGDTEALLLAELEQLQTCPESLSGLVPPPPGPRALLGSCYGPPLQRWRQVCGDRLLVLRSEALFRNPEATLERCARFLGVSPTWERPPLRAQNVNPQPQPSISPASTQRLQAFLEAVNPCVRQDNRTAEPSQPGAP
jgi:tetratricopeptide (TPR) repeat protein